VKNTDFLRERYYYALYALARLLPVVCISLFVYIACVSLAGGEGGAPPASVG
jgi:hypothetical protein